MASSLTPKQQRFVEEYLVDLNATGAAIRAGYAESGAHVEGARLLKNAKVAEAVAKARAERSERTRIDAEWVLMAQQGLYAAAKHDGTASALNVAARVLRDIGEHLGMYVEKHEHKHSGSLSQPEREQRVLSLVKAAAARKAAS